MINSLRVTDTAQGSFFWGNLNVQSGNIQVANLTLGGPIDVSGNLTLNVSQTASVNGQVTVDGDLLFSNTSGQLTNGAGASLDVAGHAQLNGLSTNLGQAVGDQVSFGSLSINNVNASVVIDEAAGGTAGTSLTGVNNLANLTLRSDGSITLAATASIDSSGDVSLDANGQNSDVHINGTIDSGVGDVLLTADDRIDMAASAEITTTTGDVLLTANADALNGNDDDGISMTNGASIQVGNAKIALTTTGANGGSIALGNLVSTHNVDDAISITSQAGISDNTTLEPGALPNDPNLNISAINGGAVLNALGAIGSGNDVDINVARLVFDTNSSIALTDMQGGLAITGVSRAQSGGSITAQSPLTISANLTVGASMTFTAGTAMLPVIH